MLCLNIATFRVTLNLITIYLFLSKKVFTKIIIFERHKKILNKHSASKSYICCRECVVRLLERLRRAGLLIKMPSITSIECHHFVNFTIFIYCLKKEEILVYNLIC